MRTRIKFCGLRHQDDVDAAVAAGADALGFVLWPGSRRAITANEVAALSSPVPVPRVGVLVNMPPHDARAAARSARLQAIQLHGDEDLGVFAAMGVPLVRAVALREAADVEAALKLPAQVTILIDAAAGPARGGTGLRANWALAADVARRRPAILAGGLTPENVADAIRRVRPWGVDVSSGIESSPGVKDHDAIRAFAAAVAAADREAE